MLHIPLVLSILLQTGGLRACQLHEVLGIIFERKLVSPCMAIATVSTLSHPVLLDDAGCENSHCPQLCVCEYRAELIKPDRPVTFGMLHAALATGPSFLLVVLPHSMSRLAIIHSTPEPPDARRSLPLLI